MALQDVLEKDEVRPLAAGHGEDRAVGPWVHQLSRSADTVMADREGEGFCRRALQGWTDKSHRVPLRQVGGELPDAHASTAVGWVDRQGGQDEDLGHACCLPPG